MCYRSGVTHPGTLDDALAAIRRQYGEDGAPSGRLASGSLALDRALGGGWPAGAIVELAGEEGTGKSTLALHAVAAAQQAGGEAAWWRSRRSSAST